MKKNGEEDFDVPMGCQDGAEIWDLVGIFILNKISPIKQEQNNVKLYRDDDPILKERKKRSLKYLKVSGYLSL